MQEETSKNGVSFLYSIKCISGHKPRSSTKLLSNPPQSYNIVKRPAQSSREKKSNRQARLMHRSDRYGK